MQPNRPASSRTAPAVSTINHRPAPSLDRNFRLLELDDERHGDDPSKTPLTPPEVSPPQPISAPPLRRLTFSSTPTTPSSHHSFRRFSLPADTTTLPIAPRLLTSLRILPEVIGLSPALSLLDPSTDVIARVDAIDEVASWLGLDSDSAAASPTRGSPATQGFNPWSSELNRRMRRHDDPDNLEVERDSDALPADIERLDAPVKQWIAAIVLEALVLGHEAGRREGSVVGSP